MTYTWFLMIGTYEFHLSVNEVNALKIGEMVDLLNHLSVYKGAAKYKKAKLTYDQSMMLR